MFEQFLNSNNSEISSRAEKLANYTNLYQQHQLSKPEFDELCQDLLSLDQIDQLASTVEIKEELQEAFEAMMKIVESIPIP